MARSPRFEFPGAYHHVMSRGNRGDIIYLDTEDHMMFLRCLAEASEMTGWRIHAYVLMPNHYHLLLETPEANMATGMQWLQSVYTQSFNKLHRTCGHVFQGRYKSLVIDPLDSRHILSVSDYIHLNPVRAGIARDLNGLISYEWSSLPSYASTLQHQPRWLEFGRIFRDLGCKDAGRPARKAYCDQMTALIKQLGSEKRASLLHDYWRKIRRGWFLGSDQFKDRILTEANIPSAGHVSTHGKAGKEKGEIAAAVMIDNCLRLLDLDNDELPRLKKTDYRKQLIAWIVRKHTCVSNPWLSTRLHMGHWVNVSNAMRIIENVDSPHLISLRTSLEKGGRP